MTDMMVDIPDHCETPGCPKAFGHTLEDSCYEDHWPMGRMPHKNGDCKFDQPCWDSGAPGRLRRRRHLLRMLGISTGYIDVVINRDPFDQEEVDEWNQELDAMFADRLKYAHGAENERR